MAMISLLVCSRISGNDNWRLIELLDSLKLKSADYDNFEVLVKFDDDDKNVRKVLPRLDTYPFTIKYIIEPRGRGYIDLHIFYNRMFSQVDPQSVVIGAVGDDFEVIVEGWDELVLSKIDIFPDRIFIIHGRPHPPIEREDYEEQKFYLGFDINDLENLYIVDEPPMWSRKLLDICGGFGHLSFTDCWTLSLEYFLYHRCGLNRTIFLEHRIIDREPDQVVDRQGALRWWTDRVLNFAFARSTFFKTMVENQAVNIYTYIAMSKQNALPPSMRPTDPDFVYAAVTYTKPGRLQRMVLYATYNKQAILDKFPSFLHARMIKLHHSIYPRVSSMRIVRSIQQKIMKDIPTK